MKNFKKYSHMKNIPQIKKIFPYGIACSVCFLYFNKYQLFITAQGIFKTLYLWQYMQTTKRIFNIVKNIPHIVKQ